MSKTKRKPKRHIRYSATEILEQAQEAVEVWPVNDFETIDVYAHMPKNPKKKKKKTEDQKS